MKRRLQFFIVGVLVLSLLLLASCGADFGVDGNAEQTDEGAEGDISEREDLIVVGVCQVGSESVWRTANTESIQQTFTGDNGYFLIFNNARQKQENQIKAVRRFISQKVDYIVISPITEDGWDTVLKEAKDAEIPVILMDRKVNVSDPELYTAWVGSDFFLEGKNAGEWLEQYLEKKGMSEEEIHIVVLQGTEGSSAMIGRSKGFESVADKHKNWIILEQAGAEYTTAKAKEEMKRMLDKYPDIDVVVSQNDDMTFGAIDAIEECGLTAGEEGDVILISFDAVYTALKLVEAGKIGVDVECNPLQGPYVESIIKALEYNWGFEKENYVPEQVFYKENVSEFLPDRKY